MTPLSSYAKTMPSQPTNGHSDTFLEALSNAHPDFNVTSSAKNFYFFSLLISEFQIEAYYET